MSRLLTGYAGWFNKKYRGHGQPFQNRCKSILCQQDPYLKELLRYIHLNPLRAGLVTTFQELDTKEVTAFGKSPQTVRARALLCFWAHRKLGMRITEIAKRLKITQPAASRLSKRGEQIEKECNDENGIFVRLKNLKSLPVRAVLSEPGAPE